ncbi:sialidase family protein [Corallococcus sp. bb12-1]|uniref:WD40/YVTN/BNR-like repeat-containing protein n=1 Tax=Corallococcus sp. bb12-1 TaxID=2996784 RepID=UPI0022720284|nr:sialidase family protein [Corallococcus sp. bb12-1]MCY1046683.1 sialidase family protein [Corallococcus sp. bb12-1]
MKKPRITGGWGAAAVAVLLGSGAAWAHAGLPETSNVTLRRGHTEDYFVGATFGAVISRDSGQTWRWVCPDAMGYGGWRPESFVWRESGELLAATGNALLRSKDGACSWSAHPSFKDTWVTGLAVHPTDDAVMYTATGRSTSATNGLFRSDDGGETWRALPLQRVGVLFSAVRVSTANPSTLYVSASDTTRMYLFRSDDAGETWEEAPQTFPTLVRPFDFVVTATDPVDPKAVWARVSAQGSTHILHSTDGGRTFTARSGTGIDDVFVNMDVSSDGGTAWVSTYNSFFRSQAGGAFDKLTLPTGNACVTRVGEVLYGCGSPWLHDWSLARSHDEGTTWEPLFSLENIQGSHQCPAGTPVRDLCPSRWPQLAETIGAPLYPDGIPDAGVSDAGTSTVDAGVVPPSDAGTPPDGEDPKPPSKSGCAAAPANTLLPFLFLLPLWRRGRRREDSRP